MHSQLPTPGPAQMPEAPDLIALLQQTVVDIDRLQCVLNVLENTELFPDRTDFGSAREVLGSIDSLKFDLMQRIGELTLGDRMDGDQLGCKVELALAAWRDTIAPKPKAQA